jgi:hypothetical protein
MLVRSALPTYAIPKGGESDAERIVNTIRSHVSKPFAKKAFVAKFWPALELCASTDDYGFLQHIAVDGETGQLKVPLQCIMEDNSTPSSLVAMLTKFAQPLDGKEEKKKAVVNDDDDEGWETPDDEVDDQSDDEGGSVPEALNDKVRNPASHAHIRRMTFASLRFSSL